MGSVAGAVLRQAGVKMLADFNASRAIDHRAGKGSAREDIVLKHLQKYLPGTVKPILGGEVLATTGARSGQCDILVVDPATPPLYMDDRHPLVPVECVYGMLEVKSNLTRDELVQSCEAIAKLKEMPKTSYRPSYVPRVVHRHGKTHTASPVAGIIFGYTSATLETLADALGEWCSQVPVDRWPDSVWVLSRGSLSWGLVEPGISLIMSPRAGCRLHVVQCASEGDALFAMTVRLSAQFSDVFMPPFHLEGYASTEEYGFSTVRWVHRADSPDSSG